MAAKYGCMKYIKLQHQVVEARWAAEDSKWHLQVSAINHKVFLMMVVLISRIQIKDLASGVIFADSCDVFLSASGVLNDWKWPSVPGLLNFKGKLLHSANWDEDYDYSVCSQRP